MQILLRTNVILCCFFLLMTFVHAVENKKPRDIGESTTPDTYYLDKSTLELNDSSILDLPMVDEQNETVSHDDGNETSDQATATTEDIALTAAWTTVEPGSSRTDPDDPGSTSNVNECLDHNGGCQYGCEDTSRGHRCLCPPGLSLSRNLQSCRLDTNPCLHDNGGCQSADVCVADARAGHHCIVSAPPSPGPDRLLTGPLVVGILIWLTALSLILVAAWLHLCLRRRKDRKERDVMLRYAGLLRTAPIAQQPRTTSTGPQQ